MTRKIYFLKFHIKWSHVAHVYCDEFNKIFCILVFSNTRELKEESGLHVSSLDEVGRLMFEFVGDPQLLEVHVFAGSEYTGEPVETQGKE